MEVFLSPYELFINGGKGVQRGSLIKVIQDNVWGVADVCPHPNLGDLSWEEEIKKSGSLYKRALQLALEDWDARKRGLSLLADKNIRNNFLITDYHKAELNNPDYAEHTVKIKGDKQVDMLAEKLNGIRQNISVRLDFNSKLSEAQFESFMDSLTHEAVAKIEYVEDPTVLSSRWAQWNARIPLASDWQKTSDSRFAKYKIVKPSREEIPANFAFCTLTSSMDHPVGVAHGLRLAQQFAKRDCGFLTLNVYKPTSFDKYFVQTGCFLNFSERALSDTGIGMTEELNKIQWRPLAEVLV